MTERALSRVRQRWDFCEEFTAWHFERESAPVKLVKPECGVPSWNQKVTWLGHATVTRPERSMSWERSTRHLLLATPTETLPRDRPRSRCRNYTFDVARSLHSEEPAELSEIAENREVFRVLLVLLPPWFSPRKKWAWKWIAKYFFKYFLLLNC